MLEYVVTRWYRSPELLCESAHYGRGVDIWSVGCIFAELLTHEAFFRGDNPQHQLEVIVSKIGCPPMQRLGFVQSQAALNSIMRYTNVPIPDFQSLFPSDCNPRAVDILYRMLQFHPEDRISVEDALAHDYLADFHGQMDEPVCESLFDFNFEKGPVMAPDGHFIDHTRDMSGDEVRLRIFDEVLKYRPAAAAAVQDSLNLDSDAKDGGGSTPTSMHMHAHRGNKDDDMYIADDKGYK
jgi:serine/threonine protein kinase